MYLRCRIKNCQQAYRTFRTVKDLNTHHAVFHRGILFKCPHCPKKLRTSSTARFHHYEHQAPRFNCNQCNRVFIHPSKLCQHTRVHIKQKLYKCFYGGCTKQYKHPQDLTRHVATHVGKIFECELCDYKSTQKRQLKRHIVLHSQDLKYKCSHCGTKF